MAKKSLEQYLREDREKALKQYHAAADQLTAEVNQDIADRGAAVDRETARDTDELRHQQDLAREDGRLRYDAAAVQALVERQNVEERMAAMGLGRSGTREAALAGTDEARRTAETTTRKAVDHAVGELDRKIVRTRTEANEKKAAIKKELTDRLNDQTYAMMQKHLDQANETAEKRYREDNDDALTKSINEQLKKQTGGMYYYENGKIKKLGNDSLFAALDKDLQYISGGMFGISDSGVVKVLSNVNEGLIKVLNAELRRVSNGKFGVDSSGLVVVLKGDDKE